MLTADNELKQIEQVARSWATADAAGADDAMVVGGGIHLRLREGPASELRNVDVPVGVTLY